MTIRPFANGSEADIWAGSNCDRCQNSSANAGECEIETALLVAYWDDGSVNDAIADRMGYKEQTRIWQCPEVSWTPQWKAEVLARHSQSKVT